MSGTSDKAFAMCGNSHQAHCGYRHGHDSIEMHLYDEDETRVCGVCVDQDACSNQLVHCQSRDDYLQAESNQSSTLQSKRRIWEAFNFTVELPEAEE